MSDKVDYAKLEKILAKYPFNLNEDQYSFITSYINGEGHQVLLGEAGSGKSLVMNILKKYYGDEMLLCATTGTANQNLFEGKGGEGTAHSCLSIPIYMNDDQAMRKVKTKCSQLFAGSHLIKHIVVDEFFMFNPEHLKTILMRIKRFNKKTNRRDARNIRLLGVGDPLQIPPVVNKDDKAYLHDTYDHHLMFLSSVWEEFDPEIKVFDKVERQKDKVFRACLEVFRYGQEERYAGALKWLNKRVNWKYDRNLTVLTPFNAIVEEINTSVIENSDQAKKAYYAKSDWGFNFKEMCVDEEITLCEGLRCITTVNNAEEGYFNGSFCTIVHVLDEGVVCDFDHLDDLVMVEMHKYEQTESKVVEDVVQQDGSVKDELHREVIAEAWQVPLLPVAAITGHRAQGKTISGEGVINMAQGFNSGFDFGQFIFYVMLSRFTDINNVHLARPIKFSDIKVCRESIKFWKESLECQKRTRS